MTLDTTSVRRYLPEAFPDVRAVTPIRMGLSGAGVYIIETESGEFILRLQGAGVDDRFWAQHRAILARAAASGVAPEIVHIDENARAVLARRIAGVPLPAAFGDPESRMRAMGSVVEQVRALHTLDPSGVVERDPIAYGRETWNAQRIRDGFPAWAAHLGERFDAIGTVLARDSRRVVSHNDLNPGNILWDGARAWIVDWEVAGLMHPYYDLATFSTFLNLDQDSALRLLGAQERVPIGEEDSATFAALRELVAMLIGCTFLGMVPDLRIVEAPTRGDAPTLQMCYAEMRQGTFDLQSARGQAMFGLALLRLSDAP